MIRLGAVISALSTMRIKDCILHCSSFMDYNNVREMSDADIVVKDLTAYTHFGKVETGLTGDICVVIPVDIAGTVMEFEIFELASTVDRTYRKSYHELLPHTFQLQGGIHMVREPEFLKWKCAMHRKKDIDDIRNYHAHKELCLKKLKERATNQHTICYEMGRSAYLQGTECATTSPCLDYLERMVFETGWCHAKEEHAKIAGGICK